jgi:hypothetical protein
MSKVTMRKLKLESAPAVELTTIHDSSNGIAELYITVSEMVTYRVSYNDVNRIMSLLASAGL